MFEVRNLTKHFPIRRGIFRQTVGYVKALNRVNLKIEQGQILGICGESGCGKSTLGRCAVRLITPTSGFVFLDGQDCTSLNKAQNHAFTQAVQMIFQDPYSSLNPRKKILDTFLEPLMYGPLKLLKPDAIDRTIEALSCVGIGTDVLSRYPHQFSGGQQQRLCLARALAFKPRLIVCDEILSALDLSIQAQIMELLLELRDKTNVSLMFISHDLAVVRQLCDRVVIMYLGEVIEQGSAQTVFSDPKHPYTQTLIESMPRGRKENSDSPSPILLLQDEPPSSMNIPSGCPFHPRCYKATPACSYTVAPYQSSKDSDHSWRCIWS